MFPRLHTLFLTIGIASAPSLALAQLACLPIDQVQVNDAPSLTAAEITQIVSPYEGRCLGLQEFDKILEAVTLSYVDRGLILSRAYLPEQDLTSGTLEIEVVEGTLSAIKLNDDERPNWAAMVFPGQIGKPVNIRNTEQGLDQIEAMPRWQAELSFEAAEAPGESILNVTAASRKPFELRFSTNNRGNAQTGLWISALSTDATNVLGLNDTWDLSISKSVNPGPLSFNYDEDSNRTAALGLSIPYGRWTFEFDYNFSDYELTIPGAIDLINTDGFVRSSTLSAEYLWDRDQTTKQVLGAEIVRARNENFIQDTRIDASSRILTGLKLSYGRSNPLWSGSFNGTTYLERGLRIFGGENGSSLPDGSPEPQYLLAGFEADYVRQLGEAKKWTWNSTLRGQYSADRLYGGQAFSIGGVSTVRGSRISIANGSSGILWRNEAEYEVLRGRNTGWASGSFYGAVDYGRVFRQSSLDIKSAHAIGTAVGFKLRDNRFIFDLSYQKLRSVTGGLQEPDGEYFATFDIIF